MKLRRLLGAITLSLVLGAAGAAGAYNVVADDGSTRNLVIVVSLVALASVAGGAMVLLAKKKRALEK